MSKPIVRFAPSPTGHIHIGNTRVALLNALFARREGGIFILRFDDTDLARSKKEYADSIEADLEWLGIPPDVIVRQSERFELYDAAADRLQGGRSALSPATRRPRSWNSAASASSPAACRRSTIGRP